MTAATTTPPTFGKPVADRIVGDASDLPGAQPVAAQAGGKLGGAYESAPFMRAARQPAQQVFGADNREEIGFGGPVERRRDERAARPYHGGGGGQEGAEIGDMLDDFHRQHHVESVARGRH